MEERHPIDKLFRDKLTQPEIPFDERDWTALSRKIQVRRRRLPIIWFGSGVAAAAAVVAVLLLMEHGKDPSDTRLPGNPVPASAATSSHDTAAVAGESQAPVTGATSATMPSTASADISGRIAEIPALAHTPVYKQAPTAVTTRRGSLAYRKLAPTRDTTSAALSPAADRHGPTRTENVRGRWALSITAAPDLSGTQPLNGQLSGNVGFTATYRLNRRLSISSGVLFSKKRYETDFAHYRPSGGWSSNPQLSSTRVYADCNVLDIPLNLNFDIAHRHRSTWFATVGASSYLMLSETYDYTYPPHEYGYPKKITIHNQNRHMLGIGNVSVGYRRRVNSTFSISVQPFVKVPLTGIGNGNLKLYSTGVAVSAEVDFSRRRKP